MLSVILQRLDVSHASPCHNPLDTSTRTSSSYDDDEEREDDLEMVEMELGHQSTQEESESEQAEETMTKPKTVTFAPAPVVVPPVGKGTGAKFFSLGCSLSLAIALVAYSASIALAALLAHLERHIGLTLLSLLPAVFMMAYLQHLFPLSVLRQEMLLTFFLAILYMGPVVILENVWYYGVLTKSHLDDAGNTIHTTEALTWAYRLLASFVRAYLVAGVFEEGAKFLALRRLRTLPYVTDPRALVTYGLCAGVAFGTVEDLFIYAFSYGVNNTVARAFLSVPLHGMTGMLIACALAEDRFLAPSSLPPSSTPPPSRPWWRIIASAVFVHGSFDLLNFLLAEKHETLSLAVEVGLVLVGFVYVRVCLLRLLRVCPVEDDLQARLAKEKEMRKSAVAVAAAAAAVAAEEEEGRDFGVEGGSCKRSDSSSSGREGGIQLPTTRYILTVVGVSCVFCTAMLLFLYLCPLG